VVLSEGLEHVKGNAFQDCPIQSLTLPSSLIGIDGMAFYCDALTELHIPAGLTHIDTWTFDCPLLERITVAEGNPTYHAAGNCLIETATGKLIKGCKSSVIPADGSVRSIGEGAFAGVGITEVTIPASVTRIDDFAFSECKALERVTFAEGSQLTSVGAGILRDCTALTELSLANCTKLARTGFSMLRSCTALERVTLPASLNEIDKNAFYGCTSLSELIFCGSETEWAAVQKGKDWDRFAGEYHVTYQK